MSDIYIGDRVIRMGNSPYIVAEVGINHNGSMELAKEMIMAAARSGAHAVKFQNYQTEDFIFDKSICFDISTPFGTKKYNQYDLFKQCELSDNDVADLFEFSTEQNIDFHSTPTSNRGVDLLKELGVKVIKNGSDFLSNLDLIRHMSKTGLPVVLSTGMGTYSEIEQAVNAYKESGGEQLILLHCTSSYPVKNQDINLLKIQSLAKAFAVPVGFSDHSIGNDAATLATAMGACWIEKHFTTDQKLDGPDHHFSILPDELSILVNQTKRVIETLGSNEIKPAASEISNRNAFQLSIVARTDIKSNQKLSARDLVISRPGGGVPPDRLNQLIGKTIYTSLEPGQVICDWMLEGVNNES